MTRSVAGSRLGSEFDEFLYAPIGEENNGMLLSVLSALARQNVDPWEEAAVLTRLPGAAAIRQLAGIIASLPDGPAARPDPLTTAARLVALLPSHSGAPRDATPQAASDAGARNPVPEAADAAPSSPVTHKFLIIAVYIAFVLLGQWLIADNQTPAEGGRTPAAASTTLDRASAR